MKTSEERMLLKDGDEDSPERGERGLSGTMVMFSILIEVWVKTERMVHLRYVRIYVLPQKRKRN